MPSSCPRRRCTRRTRHGGSWKGFFVEIRLPEGVVLKIDGPTGQILNYTDLPQEVRDNGFLPRPVSAPVRIVHALRGVFTYSGYLPWMFGEGDAWLIEPSGHISEWPGATMDEIEEEIDLRPEFLRPALPVRRGPQPSRSRRHTRRRRMHGGADRIGYINGEAGDRSVVVTLRIPKEAKVDARNGIFHSTNKAFVVAIEEIPTGKRVPKTTRGIIYKEGHEVSVHQLSSANRVYGFGFFDSKQDAIDNASLSWKN